MRVAVLSIAVLVVLGVSTAVASVPPMINYQGKLMQPSGVPVPDGTYQMTFAIYDVPTGGTPLWSETNGSVQVKGGLFSVLLGSVVNLPPNIFDSPDRWFGVTVGSDPEMTPRQRIASAAYAVSAGTVSDGAVTTSKVADGAVTSEKIGSGAVTGDKLAAGLAVPLGAIIDWYRFDAATPVPDGFAICDGSAVTDPASPFMGKPLPNLVDRFTMGVTPARLGETGGANSVPHTHSLAGHTHAIGGAFAGVVLRANHHDHADPQGGRTGVEEGWWGGNVSSGIGLLVCFGGPDSWELELAHSHTAGGPNVPDTGGASNAENRPAYVGVLKIMRVR